jgi:hypothetical protein
MSRFAEVSLGFFSSSMASSELRALGQEFYVSTHSGSSSRFSAYLDEVKSKLPLEDVKTWVESRYADVLGTKVTEIENALSVKIANRTSKVITAEELKKFAVRSITQAMMFLEMTLFSTKFDILGVPYELTLTNDTAFDVAAFSTSAGAPNIDWAFVSQFVENWYTEQQYSAPAPVDVEVNPFLNIRINYLQELEMLIVKLAFGAAMDIVNSNFKDYDVPLPLVDDGLSFTNNHPVANSELVVPNMVVEGAICLKTKDMMKSFFTELNSDASTALLPDPIPNDLVTNSQGVKTQNNDLNAEVECNYTLKNLAGLSSQKFADVDIDGELPCGMGPICKVCTQGKACGDQCIPQSQSSASCVPGCAVNAMNMTWDVDLSGRRLHTGNKSLGFFCKVCPSRDSVPCGSGCIKPTETCIWPKGCAITETEAVCKVCTGKRKK